MKKRVNGLSQGKWEKKKNNDRIEKKKKRKKELTFHERLRIKLAKPVVFTVAVCFCQIRTRFERLARATLLTVREGRA